MLQQINWRQSEEEVCRTGSHIFSQGMFAGSKFADAKRFLCFIIRFGSDLVSTT